MAEVHAGAPCRPTGCTPQRLRDVPHGSTAQGSPVRGCSRTSQSAELGGKRRTWCCACFHLARRAVAALGAQAPCTCLRLAIARQGWADALTDGAGGCIPVGTATGARSRAAHLHAALGHLIPPVPFPKVAGERAAGCVGRGAGWVAGGWLVERALQCREQLSGGHGGGRECREVHTTAGMASAAAARSSGQRQGAARGTRRARAGPSQVVAAPRRACVAAHRFSA